MDVVCVSRVYGSEKGNKTPDDMLVNYICVCAFDFILYVHSNVSLLNILMLSNISEIEFNVDLVNNYSMNNQVSKVFLKGLLIKLSFLMNGSEFDI